MITPSSDENYTEKQAIIDRCKCDVRAYQLKLQGYKDDIIREENRHEDRLVKLNRLVALAEVDLDREMIYLKEAEANLERFNT